MLTFIAFVIAIGVLIAVHEYGHYRVAVACGVRVQRFGIATFPVQPPQADSTLTHRIVWHMTKPVWEWQPRRQHRGQSTVFAIGVFPIAGYVQMLGQNLDEVVAREDEPWSFKNKSVWARIAIVAAGPIANLLLAVLLYSAVNWYGIEEPKPVLGKPVAASVAERAGLRGGERVTAAGFEGEPVQPVESFEDVRWLLTRGAIDARDVRLVLGPGSPGGARDITLPLSQLHEHDADAQLLRKVGVVGPFRPAAIAEVAAGPAQRAGLQKGDVVRSINGHPVSDASELFTTIRAQVQGGHAVPGPWRIERGGRELLVTVVPDVVEQGTATFARVGIQLASAEMAVVRRGAVEGLAAGVARTWEMSELTVRMLGRMLVGRASLKNLSGPITIADYAGKSAAMGLTQYILFLAVISVSLGVLNLLPLPVLDGGHLMYYLWEVVTGKTVSDAWMERLQRGGVAVLLVMMSIALFNDVTRLFG